MKSTVSKIGTNPCFYHVFNQLSMVSRLSYFSRIILGQNPINPFLLTDHRNHSTMVPSPPPPSPLLGPPEIYLPTPASAGKSESSSGDPFIHSMVSYFNNYPGEPPMGWTENNSPTFLSSGNPCLDFFFHVVPDTPPESLIRRLYLAWNHDALTTLKLVCNLRGVRGTGKSDKEGFYTAALWLHKNHPKTLAFNVRCFADFGYFKDLPEILDRLIKEADVRGTVEIKTCIWTWIRRSGPFINKSLVPREQRIAAALEKDKVEKEKARDLRKKILFIKTKKVDQRYSCDPDYRFLHDRVSDVFAELLVSDLQSLNSGQIRNISLAAKWCPSLNSSYDRSILLCESIARRVFPRDSYPEYDGIEEAHYAYRTRCRLHKEYLVPLRKALELPEIYMSANLWNLLPYNRVASVAMKTYKDLFLKHDKERFEEYLQRVQRGEAKIAAGALLPHKIIASLEEGVDGGKVAELQWQRMVDDMSMKGKLRNCIAVCDVSGSMYGTPMDVCVALGLLMSELSEEPWKGKVITFSANPQLHVILGDDLESKTQFISNMDFGLNTDFQKVFDQILKVAIEGKLKEEEMIKRVFVFSDMEFDQASPNRWETDYEAIQRKFKENGYAIVPEIVFWNLRNSRATPVPSHQSGVALVSGFSRNLLKMFMNDDELTNPNALMERAISGEEYQKLIVLD